MDKRLDNKLTRMSHKKLNSTDDRIFRNKETQKITLNLQMGQEGTTNITKSYSTDDRARISKIILNISSAKKSWSGIETRNSHRLIDNHAVFMKNEKKYYKLEIKMKI